MTQEFTDFDRLMMRRALELAKGGEFTTSPNPMVGCVIVDKEMNLIGQGYHRRYGEGHAEVNAVASVADKSRLEGATVYVTLEPCSHYGKTPPCAKLLIDSGVGRVVSAMVDPNPKVAGRGLSMLRDAGIAVESGLLESEARELNRKFIFAQTHKRAFVTAKWACSADGFLDWRREGGVDGAARFSTPLSALAVMKLRAANDAILVGGATVLADNPSLTLRNFAGHSPKRVVLDASHLAPSDARVFSDDGVDVVYVSRGHRADLPSNVTQIVVESHHADPEWIARLMFERFNCNSLLVEGGASVLKCFLESGVVDYIREERTTDALGPRGGAKAPVLPNCLSVVSHLDGNRVTEVVDAL